MKIDGIRNVGGVQKDGEMDNGIEEDDLRMHKNRIMREEYETGKSIRQRGWEI